MRNGIVIRPLKVVYWYVPKAACTSFKLYFADLLALPYDRDNNATVHNCGFELIDQDQAGAWAHFQHYALDYKLFGYD